MGNAQPFRDAYLLLTRGGTPTVCRNFDKSMRRPVVEIAISSAVRSYIKDSLTKYLAATGSAWPKVDENVCFEGQKEKIPEVNRLT